VKEAYKRLALRWHPDLCPDHERNQAEAAFKDIAAAYARISKGIPGCPFYLIAAIPSEPGSQIWHLLRRHKKPGTATLFGSSSWRWLEPSFVLINPSHLLCAVDLVLLLCFALLCSDNIKLPCLLTFHNAVQCRHQKDVRSTGVSQLHKCTSCFLPHCSIGHDWCAIWKVSAGIPTCNMITVQSA